MSAPAHANGADKYGAFNWRENPVQAMTYVAAVKRHLDAWIDGQDNAEDTGIHHFSHILASMNILADAMALGNLIDNRPPKGPAADMLRRLDKSIEPHGVCSDCLPGDHHAEQYPGGAHIICECAPSMPNVQVVPERFIKPEYINDALNLLQVAPKMPLPDEWTYELPTKTITAEPWGAGDGPIFEHVSITNCCGMTGGNHSLRCAKWGYTL
jgi:hypothetical protein